MKHREPLVARGDTGGRSESTDNHPALVAGETIDRSLVRNLDDPRAEPREGRRLSDQADANDLQGGPTAAEPGQITRGRQPRLLTDPLVSAVPYGALKDLAKTQIRRECRCWEYDWNAYVGDGPEWGVTEAVHRRAVHQARKRGLDCRPTDIPTDTVLKAVQSVFVEWQAKPELRPSAEGFNQEQARRGEVGRVKQRKAAAGREAQVVASLAEGECNNAEIGRRLGIDRSTVARIRHRLKASQEVKALAGPAYVDGPLEFPVPEMAPAERWPVVQFMKSTGIVLDVEEAIWLADIGRSYEAEGRDSELLQAIRVSASVARDPWAYLQRCVGNRGDAWTVTPQLLADVLSWAGQRRLEYTLVAIAGGYVKRPLPYLREVLADAVANSERPTGWPDRPVAIAVGLARHWTPALEVVDAAAAIATEDATERTGHLDSYRRRYGAVPWELEGEAENAAEVADSESEAGDVKCGELLRRQFRAVPCDPEVDGGIGLDVGDADGSDCCVGLKGFTRDEFTFLDFSLRGCLKMGKAGQSAQGEAGHCDVDPGFCGFTQCFIVLAQPPLQVQPTEGAFHDPPPRQHLEGMLLCWAPHQLQGPAAHRPGPLYQFAAVGPISPDQL